LILTKGGTDGLDAAGGVIREFGEFVARDQVMVGAIIFGILVVIQFVVITKGATRISEVAARFMLDGLPGRQMAIDADLHAGLIDQHEAHRRRETVYRQADFFGAMDGAGKFVRGDAVAGVIIIAINISAGLFLGMVNHGMALGEAINIYTKLTIGDGLVSQIPAFLISLAAGLIVTRSSSETDLGKDVVGQLFGHRSVLATSAAFLVLLALTPLPKLPLLALAGALGGGAFLMGNRPEEVAVSDDSGSDETAEAVPSAEHATDRMEDLLHVDPLELEIGYRLIALADPTRGGDLLDRLRTSIGSRFEGPWWGRGSPTWAGSWRFLRRGWSPVPTAATASNRSRGSRRSGFMPMAVRSPSWRAAGSSRRRRPWPDTSARSCSDTPTS
jgi:flagellar biosynthesis protein FlhA